MEEGKEPLDDFTKAQTIKKLKFEYFTKMFWDPIGAMKLKEERMRSNVTTSDANKSNTTPNTS